MAPDAPQQVAADLSRAGYRALFLGGEHSASHSIWREGENRDALMDVVRGDGYGALERVLASEVLFENDAGYPPDGWEDLLGGVYAQALALTGTGDRPIVLTGNEWGLMYHGDDVGALGAHLLGVGRPAIRHLVPLLDDRSSIFYEGSQEAMLGGSLGYRVKDAAAYYIGRLAGVAVPFHEAIEDRDREIERLRSDLPASSG